MKLLLALYRLFRIAVDLFYIGWYVAAFMAIYGAYLYFSGSGRP